MSKAPKKIEMHVNGSSDEVDAFYIGNLYSRQTKLLDQWDNSSIEGDADYEAAMDSLIEEQSDTCDRINLTYNACWRIPDTALKANWMERMFAFLEYQAKYDDPTAYKLLEEIGYYNES